MFFSKRLLTTFVLLTSLISCGKKDISKIEKPTELKLFGYNKQELGQFAANLRSKRPPEPFKGKGIKYSNEFIFRKEGKKI